MNKLKVLDLFSGIGGFSLGLERTGGFETVAFCEIDPFCRKVLAKHWPDVPCFEDVTKLRGSDVGPIDLICGGYPCQPFSGAGERRGAEDDRHLWPSMFGVIRASRPAWVIGENVAGHITMGLDAVLSDLEGEGYAVQAFVIPACAVDAKHRRDRVWIIANARGKQHKSGGAALKWTGAEVISLADADAIETRLCGNSGGEKGKGREYRNDTSGCRWLWPTEPDVGRVAHGVSRRVDRLRSLGNAVVPQIPELLGRAILEARAA